MEFKLSLIRKSYVIFVGLLILLVAAMLGWISSARLEAFHRYQIGVGQESVIGVEKQVAFYISEKQRLVELFVLDHIDHIRQLAANPDNDELHEMMGEILTRDFPDRFAFSVTDNAGTPRFEDFDGLISTLCLSDVKQFSQNDDHYHPYIHPNTEGYHFDIMVRYGKDGKEGIFFISFLADILGNIINSIQSPDHKIMLILPEREDLIEVVAEGSRIHWERDDYRLTAEERAHISVRQNIKGTRWQAIDFHNPILHHSYMQKLIYESFLIFLLFIAVALLLVLRLRREERQREAAEKQKQALMSVISHEIRSPASIIKSALDLVTAGAAGEVNADVAKYLGMALSNTSRLLLLVDDFLEIQKIESENLNFDLKEIQLCDIVTDAVKLNKLYAENFSAHFELQEPLADGYVLCDPHRIEQVLTNFLTNAVKYGAQNDTIEITVAHKNDHLRVSVRDHGSGIPTEFQTQVFNKFAMANAPRKNESIKSSGLGLSIAKAIIERHSGSIGFETKAELHSASGTTFWFELPIL